MQAGSLGRPVETHRVPSAPGVVAAPVEGGGRSSSGRTTRTILVVDDDPNIRALVTEALIDDGYSVVAATDGAQALELIGAVDPCLILLDMRMPVMDGWAFAAAYRRRAAEARVPIVVMTAARDARSWADQIAADGVLPKPFDLHDLAALVARYC